MTRTTLLTLLCLPIACASAPNEPEPEPEGPSFGERATRVGSAVATAVGKGAVATGKGVGTAVKGVRNGFQEPEGGSYGPFPKRYVRLVKSHFTRALRYPDDARFAFGRPVRGYMNQGLFRGGGVAWQGWIVDVQVQTGRWFGEPPDAERFVVRLRDDEVIDVHSGDDLVHEVE